MEFITGCMYLAWAVLAAVHVLLAFGIWRDTEAIRAKEQRGTEFVDSWVWAIVALPTGLLGLVVYWLIHHSTLRPSHRAA